MSFAWVDRLFVSPARGSWRRRPVSGTSTTAVEHLEDRTLLDGLWSDSLPSGLVSATPNVSQGLADVAIGDDGHYVVAWSDEFDRRIVWRRFAAGGRPIDAANRYLPPTGLFNHLSVSVGMAADGSMVLTWMSQTSQNSTYAIYFARIAPNGTLLQQSGPLGDLTTTSTSPKIAVANDGRFVIAWGAFRSSLADDIHYQVFNANGTPRGGFQFATSSPDWERQPDVAVNPVTGDFTIVYTSDALGTDDVYRQVYDPNGGLRLPGRRLNADTVGSQSTPAVAMNAAGDVYFTWQSFIPNFNNQPGQTYNIIHAGTENIFLAPATPITESEVIGNYVSNQSYQQPTIAAAERRNFYVVSWRESVGSSGFAVRYRGFNPAADPYAFYETPILPGEALFSAIAMNDRGDFVISGLGSLSAQIYSAYQRYQPYDQIGVFANGVWTLDVNGNNVVDTGDSIFLYGQPGDLPVTGDWNGDGFTEIGVYRNGTWILDVNGNRHYDAADVIVVYGLAGDAPVVGDWNHDGTDEIGIFRAGVWCLDIDRSFSFTAGDAVFFFGAPGDVPVVGDPDNAGKPMLLVFRSGTWFADQTRNGVWDGLGIDAMYSYGSPGDQPLLGNWQPPINLFRSGKDQAAVLRNGTWYIERAEDFKFDGNDLATNFGTPGARAVRGAWKLVATQTPPSVNPPIVPQRREATVYRDGLWVLDGNGNGQFDASVDLVFGFGFAGALPVAGDWNGDGFDDVGVFANGQWFLDLNGNFAFDSGEGPFIFGTAGDQPVVGDWTGNGIDKIGVFRNGTWILDSNNSRTINAGDPTFPFGQAGDVAVVGDWNGDGRDDLGIRRGAAWLLDHNGNRVLEAFDPVFNYGLPGDRPVVGDWNGDGFADVGVVRNGTWILDQNGNRAFDALDWVFSYGLASDIALTGRWRIPV